MMIPELGEPPHAIRIPDLESVPLTRRVLELIDHPAFQRLRQVRQLGPTYLVYPGAVHTRFEHSIGVYANARRYLLSLLRDPVVAESLTEADILSTLLAALLHDIGHYPFAHSLEALHVPGVDTPRHEELGARIVMGEIPALHGERSIASLIRDNFGLDPAEVVALLTQKPHSHERPERRLVASIISSGIDADKADYLERDSLHMGVPYGRNVDRGRFLQALCPNVDYDAIAITDKGRAAAELFVFSRYVMFSEAYWHHTVRSLSVMAERVLDEAQRDFSLSTAELTDVLLSHSDDALLAWIAERSPACSLRNRLLGSMRGGQRQFYKRILSLNRAGDNQEIHRAYDRIHGLDRAGRTRLEAKIAEKLASLGVGAVRPDQVFLDTPPRDKDRAEPVWIVSEVAGRRTQRPLSATSRVVQGIATDFIKVVKKIRIFVAPEVREAIGVAGAEERLNRELLDLVLSFEAVTNPQQVLL